MPSSSRRTSCAAARRARAPSTAAVNGVRQVAPGVVASFLTTVMIVGPLSFMTGNIGAVLKYIPIVLVIVLVVSLVEAFLILPHHMLHSLDRDLKPGRVGRAVNGGFDWLRDRAVVPFARPCPALPLPDARHRRLPRHAVGGALHRRSHQVSELPHAGERHGRGAPSARPGRAAVAHRAAGEQGRRGA